MYPPHWSGLSDEAPPLACPRCDCSPCICYIPVQQPGTHSSGHGPAAFPRLDDSAAVAPYPANVLTSANDPTLPYRHQPRPLGSSSSQTWTPAMLHIPAQHTYMSSEHQGPSSFNITASPARNHPYAAPVHNTLGPLNIPQPHCPCRMIQPVQPGSTGAQHPDCSLLSINYGAPSASLTPATSWSPFPSFGHEDVIFDNTKVPPVSLRPLNHGADPVVENSGEDTTSVTPKSTRSLRSNDINAMRKLYACDDCRKRKTRCDPTHTGERRPYKEYIKQK